MLLFDIFLLLLSLLLVWYQVVNFFVINERFHRHCGVWPVAVSDVLPSHLSPNVTVCHTHWDRTKYSFVLPDRIKYFSRTCKNILKSNSLEIFQTHVYRSENNPCTYLVLFRRDWLLMLKTILNWLNWLIF